MKSSEEVYGLCVITAKGEKVNAQIAHMTLEKDQSIIAITLSKKNLTCEIIESVGKFSLSILTKKTPKEFIQNLGFKSGRDTDKMEGISIKMTSNDIPVIIDNAVAYMECKVIEKEDLLTHFLITARVIEAEIISEEESMTNEYYEEVLEGKIPENSPYH